MISSRVQMHSGKVVTPSAMRSWALLFHTSVPWDRPLMRSRSRHGHGLGFHQHLAHELGAELRDTQGAGGAAIQLLGSHAQGRRRLEEADDLFGR